MPATTAPKLTLRSGSCRPRRRRRRRRTSPRRSRTTSKTTGCQSPHQLKGNPFSPQPSCSRERSPFALASSRAEATRSLQQRCYNNDESRMKSVSLAPQLDHSARLRPQLLCICELAPAGFSGSAFRYYHVTARLTSSFQEESLRAPIPRRHPLRGSRSPEVPRQSAVEATRGGRRMINGCRESSSRALEQKRRQGLTQGAV